MLEIAFCGDGGLLDFIRQSYYWSSSSIFSMKKYSWKRSRFGSGRCTIFAGIAQLGEHQTEDLRAACSIHAHRMHLRSRFWGLNGLCGWVLDIGIYTPKSDLHDMICKYSLYSRIRLKIS